MAVGSPELDRTYQPVPPAERPRKLRSTVRVVLIDARERTLLFEDSDPGVPGATWWMVPGGGIDPDETVAEAAVREVAEETGLRLGPHELIGPVAYRHVVHGYSDQVVEQDETFYLARVAGLDVDTSAHTMDEQLTILQHRWWSKAELRATRAAIWPARLVEVWDLIDAPHRWPIELGREEESTVPDVGAELGPPR